MIARKENLGELIKQKFIFGNVKGSGFFSLHYQMVYKGSSTTSASAGFNASYRAGDANVKGNVKTLLSFFRWKNYFKSLTAKLSLETN